MGVDLFAARASDGSPICPALDAASSGVMWLTGHPDEPTPITFSFMDRLRALCDAVGRASQKMGHRVQLDPVEIVVQRAALREFTRKGTTSANGSGRLLGCQDGWVVCNLARPGDVDLIPAITGAVEPDAWEELQRFASKISGIEFATRAQLVGLPAGVVADPAVRSDPVVVSALGASGGRSTTPRVVDFSAMWAGPLCAHTLRLAGAEVITVEDPARPDGSRVGDPTLHARLHDGHRLAPHSFRDPAGRDAIRRLVDGADIVIESSRPRALAQLGLSPSGFLSARPGRTWISITGYGRGPETAMRVAFGDDAAAAGGLVGQRHDGSPVFLADAAADPLSGLFAACAGLLSVGSGGGHLIDVSMSSASRWAAQGPRCDGPHDVEQLDDHWLVRHGDQSAIVRSPAEALALVDA